MSFILKTWNYGDMAARLKTWKERKPVTEPPVLPTVRRSRWEHPPWAKKHVYIAWGLETGDWTPAQIAKKAYDSGSGLALQITPENDIYHWALRSVCKSVGIPYMVWEASYQTTIDKTVASVQKYQPDAYLADIEVKFDSAPWVAEFDAAFPDLPRALCATGGGLETPQDAYPWVKNWDCCIQDYLVHGENPDRGENFAYWRGFPVNCAGFRHFPVLEVRAENSPGLQEQLPLVKPWGQSFGVYLAEYMNDDDWEALKSV